MQDEVRFAVLLGRLIDLIRTGGAASDDHRAALEALGGLVGPRSLTVRTDGGKLTVENVVIPPDTPFASRLAQQMDAHGIAAIIVGAGAAAVELLHSAHAIALSSANYPVNSDAAQRLREAKVASVFLVTKDAEKTVRERRQVRLTDAIDHLGLGEERHQPPGTAAMGAAEHLDGKYPA